MQQFFYQNFNVNIITNDNMANNIPLIVNTGPAAGLFFFFSCCNLDYHSLLLYILQRGSIALTLTSYQMIQYILLSKEHYLVKSRSQHSSRTGDPQSSFSTSSVTSNPNVLYNLLAVACALTVHKIAFYNPYFYKIRLLK